MADELTMLKDLIDPEVIGDFIEQKYVDAIRFAPLAVIKNDLSLTAGSTITLPSYDFIGDAVDVEEGEAIPISKLSMTSDQVTVAKLGKAVEFTDEARIMSIGDIQNEAARQILVAINSAVETRLLANMGATATLKATIGADADPADGIAEALAKFGEDIDGPKVLIVPSAFHTRLMKSKSWVPNTEVGANVIVRGTVGMVHGCQVVTSDRLGKLAERYVLTKDATAVSEKTYYKKADGAYSVQVPEANPAAEGLYEKEASAANTAYIVKPGALAIFSKRNTLVETDRDILREIDVIKGSKIFAPYVYDKSKLIKVTLA